MEFSLDKEHSNNNPFLCCNSIVQKNCILVYLFNKHFSVQTYFLGIVRILYNRATSITLVSYLSFRHAWRSEGRRLRSLEDWRGGRIELQGRTLVKEERPDIPLPTPRMFISPFKVKLHLRADGVTRISKLSGYWGLWTDTQVRKGCWSPGAKRASPKEFYIATGSISMSYTDTQRALQNQHPT